MELVVEAAFLHFLWQIFPSRSSQYSLTAVLLQGAPSGIISHTVRIFYGNTMLDFLCYMFYHAWNDDILGSIPHNNLLVFDVRSGWEPLCQFLECPQPETPFPRYLKGFSSISMLIMERDFSVKFSFASRLFCYDCFIINE